MDPILQITKDEIVKDIDGILDAPWIVQRLMSQDYKRYLHAMRTFWFEADEAIILKFKQLLDREP
jgi:hypothetical protein